MITKEDLNIVRRKASSISAMVIGDVMLDRYISGVVERISPEAPVPILSHEKTISKAGGAANVALNLASWGCRTSLIGTTGRDESAKNLKDILDGNNIIHYLYATTGRPTTVKTRVVAASNHLLRIDDESTAYLTGKEEKKVMDMIKKAMVKESPDLIILEDYNKGLLTENVISLILAYGKEHGIYTAIDPKEINFMKYRGSDLFKPNLREAVQAARRDLSVRDLKELTAEWRLKMDVAMIAVTLGSQGVFLQDQKDSTWVKPGRAIDVIDVCGAGDAVICALALSRLSGLDLEKSGHLANLTGAYVCSHSGVVPVNPGDIEAWI